MDNSCESLNRLLQLLQSRGVGFFECSEKWKTIPKPVIQCKIMSRQLFESQHFFLIAYSWLYGYDCSNGSTIVDYTLVMTPNEAAQTRAEKGHETMEQILTQVLETQAPSVIPGFVAGSVDVTATGRFELFPSIMTLVREVYWYRNTLLHVFVMSLSPAAG